MRQAKGAGRYLSRGFDSIVWLAGNESRAFLKFFGMRPKAWTVAFLSLTALKIIQVRSEK